MILQLRKQQELYFSAMGRPVVLLLFNAGPVDVRLAQESPSVSAILACFFPAQATGDALLRVLTGSGLEGIPAARLPNTWYASTDQVGGEECNSVAHSMNDFSIILQIWRKIGFSTNQSPVYNTRPRCHQTWAAWSRD